MRKGSFCQFAGRLQAFTEVGEKRREVHSRLVEGKRVGEPIVMADVGSRFFPSPEPRTYSWQSTSNRGFSWSDSMSQLLDLSTSSGNTCIPSSSAPVRATG